MDGFGSVLTENNDEFSFPNAEVSLEEISQLSKELHSEDESKKLKAMDKVRDIIAINHFDYFEVGFKNASLILIAENLLDGLVVCLKSTNDVVKSEAAIIFGCMSGYLLKGNEFSSNEELVMLELSRMMDSECSKIVERGLRTLVQLMTNNLKIVEYLLTLDILTKMQKVINAKIYDIALLDSFLGFVPKIKLNVEDVEKLYPILNSLMSQSNRKLLLASFPIIIKIISLENSTEIEQVNKIMENGLLEKLPALDIRSDHEVIESTLDVLGNIISIIPNDQIESIMTRYTSDLPKFFGVLKSFFTGITCTQNKKTCLKFIYNLIGGNDKYLNDLFEGRVMQEIIKCLHLRGCERIDGKMTISEVAMWTLKAITCSCDNMQAEVIMECHPLEKIREVLRTAPLGSDMFHITLTTIYHLFKKTASGNKEKVISFCDKIDKDKDKSWEALVSAGKSPNPNISKLANEILFEYDSFLQIGETSKPSKIPKSDEVEADVFQCYLTPPRPPPSS